MKHSINIVKRKLWKFGYSVKDYTLIKEANVNFDLFVEDEFKVKCYDKKSDVKSDTIIFNNEVIAYMENKKVVFVYRGKSEYRGETFSPYVVFGKKSKK